MRNNRETVIIPQTIIVPTKSIFVASLVHDASCVRFGETKEKYFNRSLRHGTEILVLGSSTYRLHGTGALLVPGFCTQPYTYPKLTLKTSTAHKEHCDIKLPRAI